MAQVFRFMKPLVALVSASLHSKYLDTLKDVLEQVGITSSICPATEPRQILRWVMDLEPGICSLCLIADGDGRMTASLSTALDPSISAVSWFPAGPDEKVFATLSDTSVLITLAQEPVTVANVIATLLRVPAGRPDALKVAERPASNIEAAQPKSESREDASEDMALYEQLETMMATPVKDRPRPEPVQIQQTGLDFSLPLRKLMSKAKDAAQKLSHPEVIGAHYLLELEEPYASTFSKAGLETQQIDVYLTSLGTVGDDTEPVISDEVFEAVAHAKRLARASNLNCVRVADFMHGLLGLENGTASEVLSKNSISINELKDALSAFESAPESCEGSFFAPSSLDQKSFYEFDPAAVRSVESRLRSLPGFQKAAKRVAETRIEKVAGASTNGPTMVPAPVIAAPPPEKPEILRISSDFPPVDVIEHVADRLLEGQVVAFPSDIMFALAADATNPTAVERLRQAAELPGDKSLSILINSTSQLKHLVRGNVDELEEMLDKFWPGPLTLIFKSAPSLSRHLASGGTIAVRQPADNTSLAVLSMLGRPLVVTSFDGAGPEGEASGPNAKIVADRLEGQIALVIDDSMAPQQIRTTVVDLTKSPWEVLREGAIPGEDVLKFEVR